MSLSIHERAFRHGRNAQAMTWNVPAAVTRVIRVAGAAVKEGFEIALTMAGVIVIVVAGLALDVWIWVPRSGH